jgi:hypothetical protein
MRFDRRAALWLILSVPAASCAARAALPYGVHEEAGCEALKGWACDAGDYDAPLRVEFYAEKDGALALVASASAGLEREEAVAAECGGRPMHGFSLPTPASLKDGRSRVVYAYAVSPGAGSKARLLGSPKALSCRAGGAKAEADPGPANIQSAVASLLQESLLNSKQVAGRGPEKPARGRGMEDFQ